MNSILAHQIQPASARATGPAQHPNLDDPLTDAEQQLLDECETVFRHARKCSLEVGERLLVVSEKTLFRGQFTDFKDYHRRKWGYGSSHAYRLMSAARVLRILGDRRDGMLPESESQARPLARLLEAHSDKIPAVWQSVLDACRGVSITADRVRRQVNAIVPPPPKPPKEARAVPSIVPSVAPVIPDPELQYRFESAFDRIVRMIPGFDRQAEALEVRAQLMADCFEIARRAAVQEAQKAPPPHPKRSEPATSPSSSSQSASADSNKTTRGDGSDSPIGESPVETSPESQPIPAPAPAAAHPKPVQPKQPQYSPAVPACHSPIGESAADSATTPINAPPSSTPPSATPSSGASAKPTQPHPQPSAAPSHDSPIGESPTTTPSSSSPAPRRPTLIECFEEIYAKSPPSWQAVLDGRRARIIAMSQAQEAQTGAASHAEP